MMRLLCRAVCVVVGAALLGSFATPLYSETDTETPRATGERLRGILDPTFNETGTAFPPLTPYVVEEGQAVTMQSNDRIVVATTVSDPATDVPAEQKGIVLWRYLSDGSLDTSFGVDGRVSLILPDVRVSTIATQPDGKILVGGSTRDGGDYAQATLIRFEEDGTLDIAFGDSGIVRKSDPFGTETTTTIVLQEDGRILAGLIRQMPLAVPAAQFIISRYNADGTLDTDFGEEGFVNVYIVGTTYGDVIGVNVQSDGRIRVVGYYRNRTLDDHLTYVDLSSQGSILAPSQAVPIDNGAFTAGTVQADNSWIVAQGTEDGYGLVRYGSDGTIDQEFGSEGLAHIPTLMDNRENTAISILPNGIITVVEQGQIDSTESLVVAQFSPRGDINWMATTTRSTDTLPGGFVVQEDGKPVVVAKTPSDTNEDEQVVLLRYDTESFWFIGMPFISGGP
ncbi:MAG: delta-60 repeat domain-containing protein [Chloroflexota bacterium]